jgi:putative phosphoribosyl transferase
MLFAREPDMNRPIEPSVSKEDIKHHPIRIQDRQGPARLEGFLMIPPAPLCWVIFAHGSGSSRLSPRNLQVAQALNQAHFATLLFDLLTPEEAEQRGNVFDIPLLTRRLMLAVEFLKLHPEYNRKPIALFGASTGAAAALGAAAVLKAPVEFVISRGGRVDLARDAASKVTARTLLIVGENDEPVLTWNREILPLILRGELRVIPGATHLFEEPGALPAVVDAASAFLTKHLKPARPATTLHP